VAWEIASRLAASGAASITWHSSDTEPPPSDVPGLRCAPAGAWNAVERLAGVPFPLWSPAALVRLARAAREADVVHLHDCLYLPNLVAWAAARLARRPVVVTQHIGMVPYRNPMLRALLGAANRIFGRLVLGSAAQAIFVSEAVRDYFAGFVRFGRPPLRVPNGVDARVFAAADGARRDAVRQALGVAGAPLLLFVGRFVEKKGLRLLHSLAQRLPHLRWVFAGWGPLDPERWALPNVSVQRGLSRERLVPFYQAADLLVLPSVGEGFPLVVQEAMACGTPALVAAETAAGAPEAAEVLLREALQPADSAVERWAARIDGLVASPEALRPLRPRVAELARARWSWDECAQRYAEILRTASGQA